MEPAISPTSLLCKAEQPFKETVSDYNSLQDRVNAKITKAKARYFNKRFHFPEGSQEEKTFKSLLSIAIQAEGVSEESFLNRACEAEWVYEEKRLRSLLSVALETEEAKLAAGIIVPLENSRYYLIKNKRLNKLKLTIIGLKEPALGWLKIGSQGAIFKVDDLMKRTENLLLKITRKGHHDTAKNEFEVYLNLKKIAPESNLFVRILDLVNVEGCSLGNNLELPSLVIQQEAGDLNDFCMAKISTDPLQLATMGKDILEFLKVAKEANVLHGDLRPLNILYYKKQDKSYGLKVCDFGYSVPLTSSIIPKTRVLFDLGQEKKLEKLNIPEERAKIDMTCAALILFSLVTISIKEPPEDPYKKIEFIKEKFSQEYVDFFSLALDPTLEKTPTPEQALILWDKIIQHLQK